MERHHLLVVLVELAEHGVGRRFAAEFGEHAGGNKVRKALQGNAAFLQAF